MKEIGPIAGIDRENTMTEINHVKGIDCQSITKMIMKESIIAHFKTMEIGENIKIFIKTNIGMKSSMIEIDYMIEMILIVKIDCKTTVEMSIKWKIINIREGLEINHENRCEDGYVNEYNDSYRDRNKYNTNTEMTDMTKLEAGQKKNLAHMVIKIVIVLTQNLKNCTKYCHP